jgi:hypothetical protein
MTRLVGPVHVSGIDRTVQLKDGARKTYPARLARRWRRVGGKVWTQTAANICDLP